MINQQTLQKKIAKLKTLGYVSPESADVLEDYLLSAELRDLHRLSPQFIGEKTGLDTNSAEKMCISASKAGIFDMEWSIICPLCGGIESHDSIGDINHEKHHCALCDQDIEINLNSQVEILFSISRDLLTEQYSFYNNFEDYYTNNFTRSVIKPPEIDALMRSMIKAYYHLDSSDSKRIEIETVKAGELIRLISLDKNMALTIKVTNKPVAQIPVILDTEISEEGFTPKTIEVSPCKLIVH